MTTPTPTAPRRVLPAHWPVADARPPLERHPETGWLAGVCAGVARHLRVNVWVVRAVVVMTFLGWVGLPGYLFLWFAMPRAEGAGTTPRIRVVLAASALAVLVGAGAAGDVSGLGTSIGVPLLVAALGLVLAWSRLAAGERRAWVSTDLGHRESIVRAGGGAALVFAGLVMAAASGRGLDAVRDVGIALVVLLGGLAAILAPYGMRLWDDTRRSQEEAAMANARADVASHLHDSVLQTLALIQRKTQDPAIAQLARAQERDLRTWLFADQEPASAGDAADVLRRTVEAVEDTFAVPVDVVITGQAPRSPHVEALASAVREATTNAVTHARPPISVYAEIGAEQIEVYVRDHGDGFDVEHALSAQTDRAGVRESIFGRLERHGGAARYRRLDDGTEITLTIQLEEAP